MLENPHILSFCRVSVFGIVISEYSKAVLNIFRYLETNF